MSKRVERIHAPAGTHSVSPSTPSHAQTPSPSALTNTSSSRPGSQVQTLPGSSADKQPDAPPPVTRDAAAPSWTSGGSEVRVWPNPSSPSLPIPGEFLPAVCSQTGGVGLHGAQSGVMCMGVGCGHKGHHPSSRHGESSAPAQVSPVALPPLPAGLAQELHQLIPPPSSLFSQINENIYKRP